MMTFVPAAALRISAASSALFTVSRQRTFTATYSRTYRHFASAHPLGRVAVAFAAVRGRAYGDERAAVKQVVRVPGPRVGVPPPGSGVPRLGERAGWPGVGTSYAR